MLSHSLRLRTQQLKSVLEKGKVVQSHFFWLQFLKIDDNSKVAVICPKKIAKTAVKRNLYRRKVYSVIGNFFSNIENGYHIALCLKSPILKADTILIEKETKNIFVKARLLK